MEDIDGWLAGVRHNQTGLILMLTEYKGNPSVYVIRNKYSIHFAQADTTFTTDVVELWNMLFETVEGSRRFTYYHPAADADFPAPNEHFLTIPAEGSKNCFQEMDKITKKLFNLWDSVATTPADISSFKSILPSLMYNINSREVDTVNGTANLTTIISSSLLFYRLLSHFLDTNNLNANSEPPITSVWQVKLQHKLNNASILFMDDRGLFDIRISQEEVTGAMDDIAGLVNALCSDKCYHLHCIDGLVADRAA
ncbi:hypothetical protein Clacol_000092 [Clathrus columnatus]|uniref:CCZ1/INTU/HSP4 first Longin domain-containing protein n=1 Tax=Clathrus columnatus TaxID=1419009 RepID=A0AAV5A1Y5_9AGAM|nr:hypothetical protein Clacol_000092 [Clathrus columnatus]